MSKTQNQSATRTVIRGESAITAHCETGNSQEPIKLKRGNKGQTIVEFQTSPNRESNSDIAFIDWLGFTVKNIELIDIRNALENIFNLPDLEWELLNRGWSGYRHRIELGQYGWVAYGGSAQQDTINVQLRPNACSQFKNLNSIIQWLEDKKAKITRCDVAHDDYEGEVININQAREWLEQDGFTTNGRRPKPREIINHDETVGNTFYIGKRQNGKMVRFYEKGKEQGDPTSNWNRVEVEFRSKDRHIPYDIIKHAGKYLAGAYPCLAFLSKVQNHIKTIKLSYEISYERMKHNLRVQSGKGINAMMILESGDVFKIISDLQREGIPKRLEKLPNNLVLQPAS